MSASGYEQTSSRPNSTSALPPKADILVAVTDFRFRTSRWKLEEGIYGFFWSGIDPVGSLLGEHLEDDAAEVTAEGSDGQGHLH